MVIILKYVFMHADGEFLWFSDMPDAPAPPTPCHSHFQQETSPLSQTIQPVPEKKPHNKREPLVDEDDYLQPQSAIKPAYIDLIDGTG